MNIEVSGNHRDLEYLLKRAYNTKRPLFVWGAPGIGKSETVRKVAEELAKKQNRQFVDWNALSKEEKMEVINNPEKYFILVDARFSQMDPSDLRGLPILNGDFPAVEWKPPLWFYVMTLKQASGIIFLDELNLAPPLVQSAGYQLVLDRCLGEYKLSDDVFVVAAGNRETDGAGVFEMKKPLCSRFLHFVLQPPAPDDWINWALNNGIDDRIVGFIQAFPNALFRFKATDKTKAYPTPRTWKFASDLIKEEKSLDIIHLLVSSAVGKGTATEFINFLKLAKQLPFEEILKNPKKVNEYIDPDRNDLKSALVMRLGEYFSQHKTEKTLKTCLEILNQIDEKEYFIWGLRIFRDKGKEVLVKLILKDKEVKEFVNKYKKFIYISEDV